MFSENIDDTKTRYPISYWIKKNGAWDARNYGLNLQKAYMFSFIDSEIGLH